MVRPDYLIFGYRIVRVAEDDRPRIINASLKSGGCVRMSGEGEIFLPLTKYRAFAREHSGVSMAVSEPRGLLGLVIRNRFRVGAWLAVLLVMLIYFLASQLVWDIRVEGDGTLDDSKVISALSDAGFSVGQRFPDDLSVIEASVTRTSPDIAFIRINRRGLVAYARVIGKTVGDTVKSPPTYEIVSAHDCVIEEISVVSGIARVKAGQTVRRGEVLISGEYPSEENPRGIPAAGKVSGRVMSTSEVTVERVQTKRVTGDERIFSKSCEILGIKINIFKKYRNLPDEYDIIKRDKSIKLFGRVNLPVTVREEYITPISYSELSLTDSELISEASERISRLREGFLSLGQITRMTSSGQLSASAYTVRLDTVYITEVGVRADA